MKITRTYMWIYFVAVAFLTMGISTPGWGINEDKTTFSLVVHKELLGVVCKKIEKLSGYKIEVAESWSDIPVSANIEDASVIEALKNILKSYSHSLMINEKDKTIVAFIIAESSVGSGESRMHSSLGVDENLSIDEYAEEYTKTISKKLTDSTTADNIDDYAEEYIKLVADQSQSSNSIQAATIDEYAKEYANKNKANGKSAMEISAANIDEYAKAYQNRIRNNKGDEIVTTGNIDDYARQYINIQRQRAATKTSHQ